MHTVRNRDFYVPAHRGGFRACCGWILSNSNKLCLLIILVSVFLIIGVLNSMYIMIICITFMVIKDSEKHHVISDISIILIWTRTSNQFSTCVNYLKHLSHDISRIIPCRIYLFKNISCWVVFKAIWQVIPTMLCFGWIGTLLASSMNQPTMYSRWDRSIYSTHAHSSLTWISLDFD